MSESLFDSIGKKVRKHIEAYIPDVFDRYLNDDDKKEIVQRVEEGKKERDNLWEGIWHGMLKAGKSYIKEFIPSVDKYLDYAKAGKDLLRYDLAGFIRTLLSKKHLLTTFIPESVVRLIARSFSESDLFLASVKKFDKTLAARIEKKKDIADVIKGIEMIMKKGTSEYELSDFIRPFFAKNIPFINK